MTVDARYGIQREYLDNADEPAWVPEDTVAALRDAIGEPPEPESGPLFLHPGDPVAEPLAVTLERGGEVEVVAGVPLDLPLGYHRLADGRRLVVSPGACTAPTGRAWGWTAQLYAARSRRSWGIGDLGDLATLTAQARAQGAGFVLVNPLHAGGPTVPTIAQQASPYSPTTRRFFSPLYLAVEDVPGATDVLASDVVAAGRALTGERHIDRDAVWALKHPALRTVFDRTGAGRSSELATWRAQRGEAVETFAAWNVLAERHGPQWRRWPAAARRPGPAAMADLPAADLTFVVWLQWQCEQQLRRAGEGVPVLQDLPIGVDPDGADAWAYQDVLAGGVTVGAPPDPFNRAGQDWGLPPFVPWKLRAADYEPFVEAVRATTALAGGLRIDHVMGLFRLWWIPRGFPAHHGGYVRYPASDLLDIVALESARADALVVGEDLGTVEDGVREELARRNVLSYRLLWFEPGPPAQWPAGSLAAVGTHDLPTVAGMWDGSDLVDQHRSGVDADAAATSRLRSLLIDRAGVEPDATATTAVSGAYRLLAQAPSVLLAASLDDALAEPVRPNMPGTTSRPNWSTALPVAVEDLPDRAGTRSLVETLTAATRAQ